MILHSLIVSVLSTQYRRYSPSFVELLYFDIQYFQKELPYDTISKYQNMTIQGLSQRAIAAMIGHRLSSVNKYSKLLRYYSQDELRLSQYYCRCLLAQNTHLIIEEFDTFLKQELKLYSTKKSHVSMLNISTFATGPVKQHNSIGEQSSSLSVTRKNVFALLSLASPIATIAFTM